MTIARWMLLAMIACFLVSACLGCDCSGDDDDDSGDDDDAADDDTADDDTVDDDSADDDSVDDDTADDDTADDDVVDDDAADDDTADDDTADDDTVDDDVVDDDVADDDSADDDTSYLPFETDIIEGGQPGNAGSVTALGPGGELQVAAVKGRWIYLYQIDPGSGEITYDILKRFATVPEFAVDAAGHRHLVYHEQDDDNGLGTVYTTDASGSWETTVLPTESEYYALALASDGSARVCYWELSDIYCASNATGSFVTELAAEGVSYQFDMALDGDDLPHLTYVTYDGAPAALHMARQKSNGTWTDAVVDTAWEISMPHIAVDPAGANHLAYYYVPDGTGYNGHFIRYASDLADSWHFLWLHHDYAFALDNPFVAADADGADVIHWEEDGPQVLHHRIDHSWSVQTVAAAHDDEPWYNSNVVRDAAGRVHLTYYSMVDSSFHRAVLDGTWSTSLVDRGGGVNAFIAMDLAPDNLPRFGLSFWYDESVYYLSPAGKEWTRELVHTIEDEASRHPMDLKIDAAGKAHLAYCLIMDDELHYATNVSGSFVDEAVAVSGFDCELSLEVDPAGKVHVVYFDDSASDSIGALRYLTNETGSWVTETVADGLYNITYPALALDGNGDAYLAYYDREAQQLHLAANASGAWVSKAVDTQDENGAGASLILDADGHAHLSYYGGLAIDQKLRYATNASGEWVIVDVDSMISYYIDPPTTSNIELDADGRVYIAYGHHSVETVDLKFATNRSGAWETAIVDDVGWYEYNPRVRVDDDGRVHLGYGNYAAIYYAVLEP